MSGRRLPYLWPAALVALATYLIDLASKVWIRSWLGLGQSQEVIGNLFRFTRGENEGLAMGLRLDPTLSMVLASAGLLVMVAFFWRQRAELLHARAPAVAMGLVFGGALGNLLDRFADGTVTDFLDVGIGLNRWPTSNIADIAIVAGLVFMAFWTARPVEEPQAPDKAPLQQPVHDNL